eukprot:jgi/Hompol1/4294/HPOL_003570-RA
MNVAPAPAAIKPVAAAAAAAAAGRSHSISKTTATATASVPAAWASSAATATSQTQPPAAAIIRNQPHSLTISSHRSLDDLSIVATASGYARPKLPPRHLVVTFRGKKLPPIPEGVNTEDPLDIAEFWFKHQMLENALPYLEIPAETGDPLSLFLAGLAHSHGWGCKRSEKLGLRYYRTAVDRIVTAMLTGSADPDTSITPISPDLEKDSASTIIQQNISIADEHLSGRATLQLLLSQTLLEIGIAYLFGWGVRKSVKLAFEFTFVAAELGDREARQHLGFLYLHGIGTPKDRFATAYWWRLYESTGEDRLFEDWIYSKEFDGEKSHQPKLLDDLGSLVSRVIELINGTGIVPLVIYEDPRDRPAFVQKRSFWDWDDLNIG